MDRMEKLKPCRVCGNNFPSHLFWAEVDLCKNCAEYFEECPNPTQPITASCLSRVHSYCVEMTRRRFATVGPAGEPWFVQCIHDHTNRSGLDACQKRLLKSVIREYKRRGVTPQVNEVIHFN